MKQRILALTLRSLSTLLTLGIGAAVGSYMATIRPANADGTNTPTVVRASRFELVDSTGKRKASMHLASTGEPLLFMYDNQGKMRLSLSIMGNQPGIDLGDAKGNSRIALSVHDQGAELAMADDQETQRLNVTCLDAEGGPAITFRDKEKNPRLDLTCKSADGPSITLKGERNKVVHLP